MAMTLAGDTREREREGERGREREGEERRDRTVINYTFPLTIRLIIISSGQSSSVAELVKN